VIPEADLVARVLAEDDRRAFAELVRRHQSAVRTVLRRLCAGDQARADDLAQETFLRAYRKLASWRGEGRLSTWLYGIAYRLWLSDARRLTLPAEAAAAEPAASAADAAHARVDLARGFAVLRDEERAALALAYGEEATHEEAARVLDWPLGTVKTHVARGKEKLRRFFAADLEAMS
jgi:RNA polymerase sigma factor (sigma-70 family)